MTEDYGSEATLLETGARVRRAIFDNVGALAVTRTMPSQVHALVYDEASKGTYGAFVGIDYSLSEQINGAAFVTPTTVGRLNPEATLETVIGMLLTNAPGIPLVVDTQIAKRLEELGSFYDSQRQGIFMQTEHGTIEIFVAEPTMSYEVQSIAGFGTRLQLFTQKDES